MTLNQDQIQALIRLADSQLDLNQLRPAEKSYRTLLRHVPAQAEALYGLAEVARRRCKPRQQRAWLEELVAMHPQHLAGVGALAEQLSAEDPALALPYLERALEVQPDAEALLLKTAECLLACDQPERAERYLRQLTTRSSGAAGAEAWVLLARQALRRGELAAASDDFARAVRLDPAIRHDARWIDVEARWRDLEARSQSPDWQARAARLTER